MNGQMKNKKRRRGNYKKVKMLLLGSAAILCSLFCLFCVTQIGEDGLDKETGSKKTIQEEIREEGTVEESAINEAMGLDVAKKEGVSAAESANQTNFNRENQNTTGKAGKAKKAGKEKKEKTTKEESAVSKKVQKKLRSMSLEEKVAQMFMLTPEALTGYSVVTAAGNVTKASIGRYPVGGFIYMGANILSESQVTQMIKNQQRFSKARIGLPLFISVDEEGGQVTRIASCDEITVPVFEDIAKIGAANKPARAYELGDTIGEYLSRMGFNLDFAPVADVMTNPANTVVKRRSYGSSPKTVSKMVLANLDGLEKHHVYGCLKHFPGHGATAGDTHQGYAYTDKTWKQLKKSDLIPFKDGIAHGVQFIMSGHISLPNVTKEDVPASLSSEMIQNILRKKLGYDGIVITDALGMGAITQRYTPSQAAVKAVLAGNDILLMSSGFHEAYEGILQAVSDGTLTEGRIDESVTRILEVKFAM